MERRRLEGARSIGGSGECVFDILSDQGKANYNDFGNLSSSFDQEGDSKILEELIPSPALCGYLHTSGIIHKVYALMCVCTHMSTKK